MTHLLDNELPIPPLPDPLAMRASAPVVLVHPLQKPGVDEHLQRVEVGGPKAGQDVRLALSVASLEVLLDVARRSSTLRAVIYGVGFKVTRYRLRGHVYQIMSILGRQPVPEVAALIGSQPTPGEELFQEPLLTHPGEKLEEHVLGGPDQDLRMFLATSLLEQVQERARVSRTQRAVIHHAGIVIDTYRTKAGAVYQTLTIAGRPPVPEE